MTEDVDYDIILYGWTPSQYQYMEEKTMARKPKNPGEYVSKAGLITRTFTTTTVKIDYVDLDKKQFGETLVTVMKPGASAIVEARKQFKNLHHGEKVQISNAETIGETTKCVAMKEEDFITNGFELKPANTETEEH